MAPPPGKSPCQSVHGARALHGGANGLLALRKAGWHTLAQDQATSVVFGMPQAAAELGAAVQVLPLTDIANAVIAHSRPVPPAPSV